MPNNAPTAASTPSTAPSAPRRRPAAPCGFACMECGHKFRSLAAAKRAAFGESGCPKCGGSDIDLP